MADWNIRPRATQCSICGKPFMPQMKGHSFLISTEEAYERKDLCTDCFKQHPPKKDLLISAVWTFTVSKNDARQNRKEAAVQKETAIQLLRKLVTRALPEDVEAIYILAILLERNKQFIERNTVQQPEGKTIRFYEFKPTGEIFQIEAPVIRAERLPQVQQRVIALLEGRESTPIQPQSQPQPTQSFIKVKRYPRSFYPATRVKRNLKVRK